MEPGATVARGLPASLRKAAREALRSHDADPHARIHRIELTPSDGERVHLAEQALARAGRKPMRPEASAAHLRGDPFVTIRMAMRHIGVLGLPGETWTRHEVELDLLRRSPVERMTALAGQLRTSIDAAIRFDQVGVLPHVVDPVLARLLEADPYAFNLLNRAPLTNPPQPSEVFPEGCDHVVKASVSRSRDDPDGPVRIESMIHLGERVLWMGDARAVSLLDHLPETVVADLAGRTLDAVLVHPLIPPGLRVADVDDDDGDGYQNVNLEFDDVPLAEVFPHPVARSLDEADALRQRAGA